MSTDSDDERSSVVKESVIADRRKPKYSYTKEKMVEMREWTLSRARPDFLSTNFDGDDGKFSPWKWLQHKWEEEGVKDRPVGRKNEVLKEDCEATVLSPQRRAFSNGCRAPEDKNGENDEGKDRGRNWRQGAGGGGLQKNDHKYHKNDRVDKRNALVTSGTWRDRWSESKNEKDRQNNKSDGRRRDEGRTEKLPEWADGPTSVDDLIELKGFDEPKKKKDRVKQEKKNVEQSKNGSRPPSTQSASLPTVPPPSQVLLNSDEDFARFLGLIDSGDQSGCDLVDDKTSIILKEESNVTGSRLSRFFKSRVNEAGTSSSEMRREGERVADGESLLSRIFDNSGATRKTSLEEARAYPLSMHHSQARAPLTLEDIERGLRTQAAKANPLEDPSGQAALVQKLRRVAREQEDVGWQPPSAPLPPHSLPSNPPLSTPLPPNPSLSSSSSLPPTHVPPLSTPVLPPIHPMFSRDPTAIAHILAQTQYNAAMIQAAQALQGPVPPHIQDKIRQAAMHNLNAAQAAIASKMAAWSGMQPLTPQGMPSQGMTPQGMTPQGIHPPGIPAPTGIPVQGIPPQAAAAMAAHSHQSAARPRIPQATSLIPASVQKKGAVNGEEKKEKTAMELEAEKRALMQQQYAAMMNAMQGGLSMGAWRTPGNNERDDAHSRRSPLSSNENHVTAADQLLHQNAMKMLMMNKSSAPTDKRMNGLTGGEGLGRGARSGGSGETMLNPLEKLLASVGVEGTPLRAGGVGVTNAATPISLEELERSLTQRK